MGVGIATSKLKPHLDTSKCIKFIKEQSNDELHTDGIEFCIDDYLRGNLFENLAEMLCCCDDTDTLTWESNGDGEYYFYYTPTYSWHRRKNEPNSIEEVHERIIIAVQRLCNLPKELVEQLINDDIYEYGCG